MNRTGRLAVLLATAAATAASIGPATAQNISRNKIVALQNWNQNRLYNGFSADWLIGAEAHNVNGNLLGDVEDIVIGPNGQIKSLIVASGGFLDIGDTHFAVPWNQITLRKSGGFVIVPVNKTNLTQYPVVPENPPGDNNGPYARRFFNNNTGNTANNRSTNGQARYGRMNGRQMYGQQMYGQQMNGQVGQQQTYGQANGPQANQQQTYGQSNGQQINQQPDYAQAYGQPYSNAPYNPTGQQPNNGQQPNSGQINGPQATNQQPNYGQANGPQANNQQPNSGPTTYGQATYGQTTGQQPYYAQTNYGPRSFRATELLNDYVNLQDVRGYGIVTDLLFDNNGELQSVVVNPNAGYGYGYYAYPFYGYRYGWTPGSNSYGLPYRRGQVANMRPFNYNNMQAGNANAGAMQRQPNRQTPQGSQNPPQQPGGSAATGNAGTIANNPSNL